MEGAERVRQKMSHLLIALDSKIPNLALMKLSAWLKARGESVRLNSPDGDITHVWISCIFTWNAPRARSVARMWEATGAVVRVGDRWLNAFASYVNRGYERARFHIPFEEYRGGVLARGLHDRVPLAGKPVVSQ